MAQDSTPAYTKIIDFIMGENTIAEHYHTGRKPAELIYYHGDRLLPDNVWYKHRLLISIVTGLGAICGNEICEYYIENKSQKGYTSPLDLLLRDSDTKTDVILGLTNLALFTAEAVVPWLAHIIEIETHSPFLRGHLNPLRSCGYREETIITSKYLELGNFKFGLVFGHGTPLTEVDEETKMVPFSFYRVFGPKYVGLEYSPTGPPMYGDYCGCAVKYHVSIRRIPFNIACVAFTAENRSVALRIGANITLRL